ncbi:MAG: 4-demethylwyosine synthase TYW1 [Candidatus Diapherotrites archaeon]
MSQKMLDEWKLARLQRAQYRAVGNHSAVKICHWTKEAIRGHAPCYKQTFYGIKTANCLEMSPAITCNQRCLHCWRDITIFSKGWVGPVDEPKSIIDGCIEERRKLLIGFRGNKKVDKKLFEEALIPKHAAISLTGEPCMYPKIAELIDEFFARGFESVYLVTSGTVPEAIEKLHKLPTNLYISLTAANQEQYNALCRPVEKSCWEKIQRSLALMRKIDTNTVIRITLINKLNTENPTEFIQHIEKAKPKYIECKAYMHVGYSKERLTEDHMPSMQNIRNFAKVFEENLNYEIKGEREDSRVLLLQRCAKR